MAEKADDLEKYGLKSPAFTLTWMNLPEFSMIEKAPKPGRSPGTIALEDHSLLLGAAVPGRANTRYAKIADNPLIFTLGPEAIEVLDSEWHDHHVLSFDPKRVRKIQLDWPERGFSLNSIQDAGNRKWSLEGPIEAPGFDLGRVNPLLEATSKLATTRFLQYSGEIPRVTRLEPARLTIRLDLLDGSPVRTLRVGGPARPGQLCATTASGDQGPVFLVPEALFSGWLKPPRRHDDLPDNVFAPDTRSDCQVCRSPESCRVGERQRNPSMSSARPFPVGFAAAHPPYKIRFSILLTLSGWVGECGLDPLYWGFEPLRHRIARERRRASDRALSASRPSL